MGDTLMPGILLVNGIESDNEDLEFDCIGAGKTIKFKRDGVEVASIGDGGIGKVLQAVEYFTATEYTLGGANSSSTPINIIGTITFVKKDINSSLYIAVNAAIHTANVMRNKINVKVDGIYTHIESKEYSIYSGDPHYTTHATSGIIPKSNVASPTINVTLLPTTGTVHTLTSQKCSVTIMEIGE